LYVTPKDQATSREHKITNPDSTNLDKADVECMVQQAQRSSSEDITKGEYDDI